MHKKRKAMDMIVERTIVSQSARNIVNIIILKDPDVFDRNLAVPLRPVSEIILN